MAKKAAKLPDMTLLEFCRAEMLEQVRSLKEDRLAGSPHKVKLANAIGSLSRSVIGIESELRQQEKHASRMFAAMTPDELDNLLMEHLRGIDKERLGRFQALLDELCGSGSVLG